VAVETDTLGAENFFQCESSTFQFAFSGLLLVLYGGLRAV